MNGPPRSSLGLATSCARGVGPEEAARELAEKAPTTCRFTELPQPPAAPAGVELGKRGQSRIYDGLGPPPEIPFSGVFAVFFSEAARGGVGWVVQKCRPQRGQTQN
jgi:hypothetical protein